MSRKNKSRHRARKARRRERIARDEHARAHGLPLPSLFPNGVQKETRDPRTRWQNLSARGGLRLGFKGTGVRVQVDFESPDAEHALVVAASEMLGTETGEA